MDLATAQAAANKVVEQLAPYCERIAIAGSIRRQKPEVKDIEIVCIPYRQKHHRTGKMVPVVAYQLAVEQWIKRKGDAGGKYTQRWLTEPGICLDLFTVTAENWGLILAIRTGSAEYSHHVLANGWVKKGYKSEKGTLYNREGEAIEVPSEEYLYQLIGIPFMPPEKRGW